MIERVEITKLTTAYFSPTLSTKQLMLNVMWGLSLKTPTVTLGLTSTSNREKNYEFGPDELVIVAAPAYGGRLPVVTPAIFDNLTGNNTPVILIMVYGDRGYDDALLELKDKMTAQGFVPIAACALIAEHAGTPRVGTERPNVQDIAIAKKFGVQIREKLDMIDIENLKDFELKTVPGNEPYKELPPSVPMAPVTSDKCVLCMRCWRWCPTNAISYNDPNNTDPTKCIKCQGCVKRCPPRAREILDESFRARILSLEGMFSDVNHDPELFL